VCSLTIVTVTDVKNAALYNNVQCVQTKRDQNALKNIIFYKTRAI